MCAAVKLHLIVLKLNHSKNFHTYADIQNDIVFFRHISGISKSLIESEIKNCFRQLASLSKYNYGRATWLV